MPLISPLMPVPLFYVMCGYCNSLLYRYMTGIFIKTADMDMVSINGQMEASFVGHSTWTRKRAMVLLLLLTVTNLR